MLSCLSKDPHFFNHYHADGKSPLTESLCACNIFGAVQSKFITSCKQKTLEERNSNLLCCLEISFKTEFALMKMIQLF